MSVLNVLSFFSPDFVGGEGGSGSGKVEFDANMHNHILDSVLDEQLKNLEHEDNT